MIVPWTLVVLIALLGLAFISGRFQARQIGQTVLAGAIVAVCVAPILARNVTQYGAWALTPQTGGHSAFWVVPLVQEASDGTPWSQGSQEMKRRIRERFGEPLANPFDEARRHIQVAREALAELGPAAVAKAWAFGAAINLASPAIIISPPIARLPRTGFFATAANSIVEKVLNFLFRSDNALYAWMLLLGIAGVAIIRLVQLSGLVVILRNGGSFPVLTILVLWSLYVLAINGPVASPKYRLPMEPALMVLTGAGLSVFRRRPVTPMRRDG